MKISKSRCTSYCFPVFESCVTLLDTSKVTTWDDGSSMASINSSNVVLGLLKTSSDGFFTWKCFKILSVLHFFLSALSKFIAEPHFLVGRFGSMCSASDLFPRLSFSAERNWFEANDIKETITTTKTTFHIGGDLTDCPLFPFSPAFAPKIPLFLVRIFQLFLHRFHLRVFPSRCLRNPKDAPVCSKTNYLFSFLFFSVCVCACVRACVRACAILYHARALSFSLSFSLSLTPLLSR